MDQENRKGRLCGLIAAGLRLEGLLRVSLERPDADADTVPQIREAFEMYSALFSSLFSENKEPNTAEDEVISVVKTEPEEEPVADEIEEETPLTVEEAEEIEDTEDSAEDTSDGVLNAEEETEVISEPEPVRPLSDTLKVDELIARKESADLRRAFTLNDKFRFRRTIFGGSDEKFSQTLQQLEAMPDFDTAMSHLEDILPENGEDNEDFIAEFAGEKNTGFHTPIGRTLFSERNTIAACVHGTQTVSDGQVLHIRLLEPMAVDDRLIPKGTVLTGGTRVQGERMEILIETVEYKGTLFSVELEVYDADGQRGILVPNSMEYDAVREIAAGMGTSMGSSINISTDAGAQIASDVGKGVIQGVSQYVGKKMRPMKITLKAGHRLLLHSPEK
mgnify:CR=1 FL=1